MAATMVQKLMYEGSATVVEVKYTGTPKKHSQHQTNMHTYTYMRRLTSTRAS